jgi:hypothetical protein
VVLLPVVGNEPLQPPEAVQPCALEAFHCSVTDAPAATVFSLAFNVTKGGVTTAGAVGAPLAPVLLCALLPAVSALELAPHAASVTRAANPSIDFNANANLVQRLRRIELITRLPRFTATTFSAELDSVHPQSLRSHIHSIFPIRQPVAICKLDMFSDANKFIRVFEPRRICARISSSRISDKF